VICRLPDGSIAVLRARVLGQFFDPHSITLIIPIVSEV
jgi:hypothetical protein